MYQLITFLVWFTYFGQIIYFYIILIFTIKMFIVRTCSIFVKCLPLLLLDEKTVSKMGVKSGRQAILSATNFRVFHILFSFFYGYRWGLLFDSV